jgi:hypothetical protein
MRDPFCPQHHPRRYSQCGCALPKSPARPLPTDVCHRCLAPYSNNNGRYCPHWRLAHEEWASALAFYQQVYGKVESQDETLYVPSPKPQKPDLQRERPTTEPRTSRPIVVVVLPPGVREYLASLGHRGGSSRSERKQAASRLNGQRGGRPRNLVVQGSHNLV